MLEKPPHNTLPYEDIITIMKRANEEGVIPPLINNYAYWTEVKYKSGRYDPEKIWAALKLHRKMNYTSLSFGKYKFRFMVTDNMQRMLHELDRSIGGNLSSNIGIADTDQTKFMVHSIIEEAISSSQIEGAATTRKLAKEMIRQEKKPKDKSEQMIFNNFFTMKEIVENKRGALTTKEILYIHQLMTEDTLADKTEEGSFRTNNEVHVVHHQKGEIVHTPPPYEEIESLMQEVCDFLNKDRKAFIHPIIKACIVHFMVGWIHPFVDGNGRTARALFYRYMLKSGYWLTEYLSISSTIQKSKAQYEKAYLYTENDDNDLGYFIFYHLKAIEKSFKGLKTYINRKQKDISQAAKFIKIEGVNDRMAQIIKLLNDDADRVLQTKELASRFQVSDFTARKDLKDLEKLGFVEAIQVNKQKKNYIKSKQFDQLIKKK